MTDLTDRLRALSRMEHSDYTIGDEAADELERLTAELSSTNERWEKSHQTALAIQDERDALRAHQKAAPLCDKHAPTGGARGMCVICAGEALQSALSRISYACGTPNEMECSDYDVHCSEDAVVDQVKALRTELANLRAHADAENAALRESLMDMYRQHGLDEAQIDSLVEQVRAMTLHPIVRETLRRELAHTARTFLRCAIVMLVVYGGMELLVIWSRA